MCNTQSNNITTLNKLFNEPKIMGILNVTPDSFYSGSRFTEEKSILTQVDKMLSEGMDIIDIGGMSTRPGCQAITKDEEFDRVVPIVKLIHKYFPNLFISVDTFRSSVAKGACEEGCTIINDISGAIDEHILDVAKEYSATYLLMHYYGDENGKMASHKYNDIINDMLKYFEEKIKLVESKGVKDIIIDPGLGFSKTMGENYKVLYNTDVFKKFNYPVLIGVSRKRMIYQILGSTPEESLNGTSILNTIALLKGADILRVHDVKEAVEAKKIISFLNKNI
ncbi:MAG: dihydropteroate synthase [Bacteroidales bacterium]